MVVGEWMGTSTKDLHFTPLIHSAHCTVTIWHSSVEPLVTVLHCAHVNKDMRVHTGHCTSLCTYQYPHESAQCTAWCSAQEESLALTALLVTVQAGRGREGSAIHTIYWTLHTTHYTLYDMQTAH